MLFRYSQWDGSQEGFMPDADDLLNAVADDLLEDGDLMSALRKLMRQGFQGRQGDQMDGLRQMLERLKQRRQQRLDSYDVNSLVNDIKERLDRIVQTEREGIQHRLDETAPQAGQQDQSGQQGEQQGQPQAGEQAGQQSGQQDGQQSGQQAGMQQGQQSGQQGEQQSSGGGQQSLRELLEKMAAKKQQFLNELPESPAGKIKQLSDYDFMDQEARRQFQELMDELQKQMMQQYFQGLQQGIQNMTPEDLKRVRDMVRDLNQMLQEKAKGGQPDFEEFMRKHGDFFGPDVKNLDDLVEDLARRTAQMQSLLDSMTPEMRQQLQDMMDSLLRDDRLRWDLAQLAANLEQLYPMDEIRQQYRFSGEGDISFEEAMKLMEELQQLDQLEEQMAWAERRGDPSKLDPDQVEKLLGPEARQVVDEMNDYLKKLEDAGYIHRTGNQLELTARAIRKIGQKAMQEVFQHLKQDRVGKHQTDRVGAGTERTDDFKKYEFGDVFDIDIQRTLMNGLRRQGPGTPVKMAPEDFEVHRTELLTQASTVLMVDVSLSMIMRGYFFLAKKTALALDSLIRTQFPRDNLYLLIFSDRARKITSKELAEMSWNDVNRGTNIQHALIRARQLLGRHKSGTRQIILVTDGEPSAHLEGDEVFFSYPPTHRTFQKTLAEATRCTREGIIINTFMMERNQYLAAFVEQMTKINRGRAFYVAPGRLGDYVLVDYLSQKRKIVR